MAVFSAAVLAFSLACVESTATPTPTATPAQTPTSTPTPTPTQDPEAANLGKWAEEVSEEVSQLMTAVPASYDAVLFTDVETMLQDPNLQSVLQEQRVLAMLGPASGAIQELVDALVVGVDNEGILGVFRTSSDATGLITALGTLAAGVDLETYGSFEIMEINVDLPLLKLHLALTVFDETTAMFATASTPDVVGAGDMVKAALDAAQQTTPGFLSDPAVAALVSEVPQGFATLIAKDCTALGETPFEGIETCTGLVISATKEGETGFITGAVSFDSTEAAQAAMPAIREQLERVGGLSDSPALSSVDGNLVRFRVPVDLNASLLEEFGLGAP